MALGLACSIQAHLVTAHIVSRLLTPFTRSHVRLTLTDLLPIHLNVHSRRKAVAVARGQPWLGVLIVERPRWDDGQECDEGTREADVERQFDILRHEADEEGNNLQR